MRSGRLGRDARYARISTDHRRIAERGALDERVHREPEDWPIPAGCDPEVYDEGCWSRVDALAGRLGLTGPAVVMQTSKVPGPGDGLARSWLRLAAAGWSGRPRG